MSYPRTYTRRVIFVFTNWGGGGGVYFIINLSNNSGDEGKSHKPAYVMLVGTHADISHARKNSSGEYSSPTQGLLKEKVGTDGEYHYRLRTREALCRRKAYVKS